MRVAVPQPDCALVSRFENCRIGQFPSIFADEGFVLPGVFFASVANDAAVEGIADYFPENIGAKHPPTDATAFPQTAFLPTNTAARAVVGQFGGDLAKRCELTGAVEDAFQDGRFTRIGDEQLAGAIILRLA